MNWLDVLLVLPLVVGLVRGLMRGLISEIIAIAVVIFGVLGAKLWAPTCSAWLLAQFAWPQGVCDVVAYTLLFLAIAIVLSILARLLSKFLRYPSRMGKPNLRRTLRYRQIRYIGPYRCLCHGPYQSIIPLAR